MDYNASVERRDTTEHRGAAGAMPEILGLGAVALLAMAALTYGYNSRMHNTSTATSGAPMSIQAQQPDRKNYVSPADKNAPPTSSSTGQGSSNGERVAPNQ